jgi:hypothetical protein
MPNSDSGPVNAVVPRSARPSGNADLAASGNGIPVVLINPNAIVDSGLRGADDVAGGAHGCRFPRFW